MCGIFVLGLNTTFFFYTANKKEEKKNVFSIYPHVKNAFGPLELETL